MLTVAGIDTTAQNLMSIICLAVSLSDTDYAILALSGNQAAMDRIEDAIDGKLTDQITVTDATAEFMKKPLEGKRREDAIQELLRFAEKFKKQDDAANEKSGV